MKNSLQLLTLSLFVAFILFGCGADTPVTNSGGPNNTDTTFEAYVIIAPVSGPADTLYFTDRNLCTGSYSNSANNTYCILNDTVSHQSVSLTFEGNTTGSPAFTFGFLSYLGGSYSGSGITGAVSLYEAVAGKIKGTFTGTFSDGSSSYQGRGVFTLKRTQ
ncbi:MAG: hypothetical protein ABI543_07645 [Ignavibacteria bacterium]